jgi:hypothetical protein
VAGKSKRQVDPVLAAAREKEQFRKELWKTCNIQDADEGIAETAVVMDLLRLMTTVKNDEQKVTESFFLLKALIAF